MGFTFTFNLIMILLNRKWMNNNLDFEEESKVAENWYKIYPMSLQTFRINLISFKAIFILDRYDEHIQITFATRYEW